jgi:GTPase SAR1 family protein
MGYCWTVKIQKFNRNYISRCISYNTRKKYLMKTYAINHRGSFDNIDRWMQDVKNYSNKNTILALVGNKIDL